MRCPYCAAEFNGNLSTCPRCGHTLDVPKSNDNSKGINGGIGDEIYKVGTIAAWLIFASGLIAAIAALKYAGEQGMGLFFAFVIIAAIVAYLSTILLRGFGQLISDTAKIRKMMEKAASTQK